MARQDLDTVLVKNIQQTIDDITVQYSHAQSVNGRARTGYYKNIILLNASLVEALLFDYIKIMCRKDQKLLLKAKTFKNSKEAKTLIELKSSVTGSSKELWVCEITRKEIDKTTSFNGMNQYALELGLVSEGLFKRLENVRTKRNEIHLQALVTSQRNYNAQKAEQVAGVFLEIFEKVEKC